MLKQHIIHHYLSGEEIVAIMPQHHGKALTLMLRYAGFALIVRIIYQLLTGVMSYDLVASRVAAILLLVILIGFNYEFMMLYLDSIVITSTGILIMDQVGLLDFSQTKFDRDSIQTITYHQYGAVDRLLNKGDIVVGIEHGTDYLLSNIVYPQKRVDRINTYKHDYILARARELAMAQEGLMAESGHQDKFELLVDKLSDIIVDYMQQPRHEQAVISHHQDTEEDYPGYYEDIVSDTKD